MTRLPGTSFNHQISTVLLGPLQAVNGALYELKRLTHTIRTAATIAVTREHTTATPEQLMKPPEIPVQTEGNDTHRRVPATFLSDRPTPQPNFSRHHPKTVHIPDAHHLHELEVLPPTSQ